jgi:predicted NAD/FAD-dependent oxidoreductase
VAAVKRWRYSQPEMTALFDNVNRPGSRILIAGDGVMGGRTEYAYDAGIKAARMMEETA